MQETPQVIKAFYLRKMLETADGLVDKISEKNGIPNPPKSGREIVQMPVYEEGFESLLSFASRRAETTLEFPGSPTNYLQAYWRRYRKDNGRITQKVVVLASTYCWARFYAAKELMHCFIDEDNHIATGTIEEVNALLEELSVEGIVLHDDCMPQTVVDEIAWVGAARFLIPEKWLPTLAGLYDDLNAQFPDKNNMLHLGQLLRAPEAIVRHRLRRHRAALVVHPSGSEGSSESSGGEPIGALGGGQTGGQDAHRPESQ